MSQIRIAPDIMRARAMQYTAQAQAMSEIITSMDNLLTDLLSEWEGSASEAYATKYAELKPGFLEVQNLIVEIASALNTTATTVEETDTTLAGGFLA
ncbi:MAG: WXG100 family type VII secretion target [Lachnospiraceae bacterium]|nr:WXG100 family type VII secretion target [Lachnospiraceae bacterium]MBQ8167590.1 WXG100 family type VII secretion target [Lachnospiraceae bacterium]